VITAVLFCLCISVAPSDDPNMPGDIRGVTRAPGGEPLAEARVTVHSADGKPDQTVTCAQDGSFSVEHLKPGKYQLTAKTEKFASLNAEVVDLEPGATARVEMPLIESAAISPAKTSVVPGGFWKRFAKANGDDWHDRTASGPDPGFRGYPAPESDPPFPFTVWPYGGSVVIGQPN